ncbi:MAG: ribonuclease R [Nitrospinota bacterium]
MKINSQTILKFMGEVAGRPLSMKDLIKGLNVPATDRHKFRILVRELVSDGVIVKLKGDKYGLAEKMNLVTGLFMAHPDGFGFVRTDEMKEDVFISPRCIKGAMNGDKVVCRVESQNKDGRYSGRIIRILNRAHPTITGIYERDSALGFVIPADRKINYDIYIPRGQTMKAKTGESVVVEITSYPTSKRNPEGKIVEILGHPDDPDVEIEMVLRKYNIPHRFSDGTTIEAEAIRKEIPKSEIQRRVDFRDRTVITIDGETAKDFDDAVSIEMVEKDVYRLGVHIADVSYYVKENRDIDRDAFERGTSIYFPDRAIPMLPFKLSDDICSLRPDEDRLTMSAILDIDRSGNVVKTIFTESVIRSAERMTYTNVAALLNGSTDPQLVERYKSIVKPLKLMRELAQILGKKRTEEGSIDFDLPESVIILDSKGKPEAILRAERNVAHKLIEEFMLAANRAVAERFATMNIPAIYRVHQEPGEDSIKDFEEFVGNFGYTLKKGKLTPADFQRLLERIKGKPEDKMISMVMLRHMRQARYSTENIGHFGLAFEYYTHFTSPIRRYPDLIVHRILKKTIAKRDGGDKSILLVDELPNIAEHVSVVERRAEQAERDIVDLKKVQFMKDKIGEVYKGIISGVTSFGIFVELQDIFVEGLVHISSVGDDYYIFNEKHHSLIGERTRKIYKIGDEVVVNLVNVSIEKRQIDLLLVKG